MSDENNIQLTILSMAAAVFLCLAAFFFFLKETEHREKTALKTNFDKVVTSEEDLKKQLKELEISKSELETTVKFHEDKITLLTRGLEAEETRLKQSESKLLQKDMDIDELKAKLAQAIQERDALVQRLDKQSEEVYSLKYQLDTILKSKEELEKKARDLAEKGPVSLGTIVIKQNS